MVKVGCVLIGVFLSTYKAILVGGTVMRTVILCATLMVAMLVSSQVSAKSQKCKVFLNQTLSDLQLKEKGTFNIKAYKELHEEVDRQLANCQELDDIDSTISNTDQDKLSAIQADIIGSYCDYRYPIFQKYEPSDLRGGNYFFAIRCVATGYKKEQRK